MLAVIGAVAIFADRRAHLWLGVFVTITIAAFLVSRRVEPLYVLPNRSYFSLFNLVTITLFVYVILYYFVRQSARLYRESEMLLRNIFPDEIADRLKNRSSDEMIADEFPSASILFADIVGFTPLAADLEPGETVNLLNEVFTGFDRLVESRGLEKIKTIGDAYMVASGVPVSRDDHARALCELAIDFQEHLAGTTFDGRRLEMRIGIASGPVTAGIIGRRKFSYDMWGDTVNLASRMEVTGTPGRIQVPARTRELVADGFVWEERGVVDVKGRGPVETWYLLRRSNQPLHPAPT
jgi:guanylate cyclase